MTAWRLFSACLVLALAACSSDSPPPEESPAAAPSAAELPVPAPDLSAMDEKARERLSQALERLAALRDDAATPEPELGREFGAVGRLLQTYDLPQAAAQAYENAARLDPEEPAWPYLRGHIQQSQGERAGAEASFRRVLALRPEDATARARLSQVLLEGSDLEGSDLESAAALLQGLRAEPGFGAFAEAGLGRLAMTQGEAAAAAEHFEAALALEPRATALHYQLGQAWRRLGDLERAERELARRGPVEVSYPDPYLDSLLETAGAGSHLARGSAAFTRGDFEAAAVAYAQAVEEAPGSTEARRNLALAFVRLGRFDEAEAQFRAALELAPDSALLHAGYGALLAGLRRDDDAARALSRAVELEPAFEDAHLNLAATRARQGDFEAAAAGYRKVLEIDPQNAAARQGLALALLRLGRREEAASQLQQLVETDPANAEARLNLGAFLAESGRQREAEGHFRQVLTGEADARQRSLAHYHLGLLLARGGRGAQAVAEYEAALGADPASVEARFNLASTLGRLGRLDEAAAQFSALHSALPEHEAARLGEATARVLQGRYRDARTVLARGIQAQPRSVLLGNALARLLATCPQAELRDGPRAVALAQALLEAGPQLQLAQTLAMALAEAGRFDEARRLQEDMIRDLEARPGAPPALLAQLRRHLASYQRGEPVREPWKEDAAAETGLAVFVFPPP